MKDYGLEVFDADKLVDSLYKREEVRAVIRKKFGDGVFAEKDVNKKALAKIVFSDAQKLQLLNSIIHPIIREELKRLDHRGKIVFAEIPLLFEAGFEPLFDRVIVVRCSENVAMARAAKRGFSEDEFHKRMAFQLPDGEKNADYIVNSDCSVEELEAQAEEISMDLVKINKQIKKTEQMEKT